MRLTIKITLALFLVVSAGFLIQGTLHYQRMEDLHERETGDDLRLLGLVLQKAVAEIWASSGEKVARAYVEQANDRRQQTRIALSDRVEGDDDVLQPRRKGSHLELWAPIVVQDSPVAAIELDRSLESSTRFAASLRNSQMGTTIAIAVLVCLVALVLSYRWIAQPTRRLVLQIERIGRGEYEPDGELPRANELGVLARAIRDLAIRLKGARESAEKEKRARAATVDQLRHADRLSTAGKLASGLAHELGTPLNVVSGRAAMIENDENAHPEITKHARIITERVDHMSDLIRQLLTFARRDRHIRDTSDARICALARDAANLLEPLAQAHEVAMKIEPTSKEEIVARIDGRSALQVLSNLMVNGIQAMPTGGKLRVVASHVEIDAPPDPHSRPGSYAALTVEDSGMGIPEELLEKVFTPFFTTKPEDEGTGLGLSICHGIVSEYGGWIDVDSKPGEGSRFTAFLPAGGST